MCNLKWPEMDELGNIKGIKLNDFIKIKSTDRSMTVVAKQQKQLGLYERRVRSECKT